MNISIDIFFLTSFSFISLIKTSKIFGNKLFSFSSLFSLIKQSLITTNKSRNSFEKIPFLFSLFINKLNFEYIILFIKGINLLFTKDEFKDNVFNILTKILIIHVFPEEI